MSLFTHLPNDLIMKIIKMETDRKNFEKMKRENKHLFDRVLIHIEEIEIGLTDVYDRDDIDKWGLEKVSLDFWFILRESAQAWDSDI